MSPGQILPGLAVISAYIVTYNILLKKKKKVRTNKQNIIMHISEDLSVIVQENVICRDFFFWEDIKSNVFLVFWGVYLWLVFNSKVVKIVMD